jgi:hypothetical protein
LTANQIADQAFRVGSDQPNAFGNAPAPETKPQRNVAHPDPGLHASSFPANPAHAVTSTNETRPTAETLAARKLERPHMTVHEAQARRGDSMRVVLVLLIALTVAWSAPTRAGDPSRRLQRIPPPARPERSERVEEPTRAAPKLKPAAPSVSRPRLPRADLLEPRQVFEGGGRDEVASFRAPRNQSVAWELAVREQGGPVVQILGEHGPAPARIAWDGRLLDGTLAWPGMTYVYDLALVDSSGVVETIAGDPFTLPSYTREDAQTVAFLMTGHDLVPGRRPGSVRNSDPVAAAAKRLERPAERLGRRDGAILVEVLAQDQDTALRLATVVQTALAGLAELADRPIAAYAGVADAAPAEGTVLIETETWPEP